MEQRVLNGFYINSDYTNTQSPCKDTGDHQNMQAHLTFISDSFQKEVYY